MVQTQLPDQGSAMHYPAFPFLQCLRLRTVLWLIIWFHKLCYVFGLPRLLSSHTLAFN